MTKNSPTSDLRLALHHDVQLAFLILPSSKYVLLLIKNIYEKGGVPSFHGDKVVWRTDCPPPPEEG